MQLGQAVVQATAGIKDENAALLASAGVTKSAAQMWEDYAKARGLATAQMTQAQKVRTKTALNRCPRTSNPIRRQAISALCFG